MKDFESHGVAVCTPRQQQQQLQQQLQQEVEEQADVGVIGNEGNMCAHFAINRTAASRVHPTWDLLGGARPRGMIARAFCCWKVSSGRKRAWGSRGLSAAVPKTMGFRPDGIKWSGMAARTPWQAAATAAAGEVTEGSGLSISSATSILVWQDVAGVGYRSSRHRWGFRRNGL